MLYAHIDGEVKKRGCIYADGDIIYAEVKGGAEAYAECTVVVDGLTLSPIIKYYKVPQNIIESSEQRIIF